MTGELVAALIGLALLDSINTSTLFLVMVILLTARRPVPSASAYAVGAAMTFFGLAVGLYLGASAAEAAISGVATWLRRGTFALLAAFLFYLAYKRLRDRPRKPLVLPVWFGPVTALPLGAAATIADLPNAFPLLVAIERLLSAPVPAATAVAVLAVYTGVYALPTVAVLVAARINRARLRAAMTRVTDRFLSGVARRSLPIAGVFALGGIASASVVALV